MTDHEAYLAAVTRALDCPRGMKRELLAGLRGDLADCPGDYDALCARFGQPEAAAQEFSACIDPDRLRRARKRRSRILASVLVLLAVGCSVLFAYYLHARHIILGDFTVELRETTVYYADENTPSILFPEHDGKDGT